MALQYKAEGGEVPSDILEQPIPLLKKGTPVVGRCDVVFFPHSRMPGGSFYYGCCYSKLPPGGGGNLLYSNFPPWRTVFRRVCTLYITQCVNNIQNTALCGIWLTLYL